MPRKGSLVRRVAWAAALSASAAALLAAVLASALVAFLLQRAEDQRLGEAAQVLAYELAKGPVSRERIEEVVRDEREETAHTGILFAVFDLAGQHLAGGAGLGVPAAEICESSRRQHLRLCRAVSANGLIIVAASSQSLPLSLFALAALAAALLAGGTAWMASRPMSAMTVAPLSRLRSRLAALDEESGKNADLGPVEHVVEVDQLRHTIGHLLQRIGHTLEQAQRFSANAAHELRTPLTAVSGELELLVEEESISAGVKETLARVHKRVSELGVVVERLLVLATPRSTAGAAMEIVSLFDLVEDVVGDLPPGEAGRVKLPAADAVVRGDAVLLSTMVANAVSNAIKFGGTARVDISLFGTEAVIRIDDDGPGLASSDRERIFEPFVRTEEALRRRLPGTGLGLALIRHVAENHGGSAWFVDKDGPGARLEIRLPHAGPDSFPTPPR